MYGVVEIQGHQYKVQEGDIVDIQKMDAEVGSKIELDQVLFIGGDTPKVGTPIVEGAKITAEVVRQARSRKIIIFKRKAGLSRSKNGHRQHYTALKITGIKA